MTISSTDLSKEIKFSVTNITATEMRLTMNVADVTTLAGVADTTSTSNTDIIALVKEVVPAVTKIQSYIEGVDLNALGLNPNPTITMVFRKNE